MSDLTKDEIAVAFMKAVYGDNSDLALASSSEQGALIAATELIADLRANRDKIAGENVRLQQRLDKNVCHSGHVTLPRTLWDCPECHNQTRLEREALRIRVQELTDRLFEVTRTLPSAVAHKEEDA
jgi:hypothetical protein